MVVKAVTIAGLLTAEGYLLSDSCNEDFYYEGKVVLLSSYVVSRYREPYNKPYYQIALAQGGFGCDPTKMGRAVFVRDLTGETFRVDRNDVVGVLDITKVGNKMYIEILTRFEDLDTKEDS